MKYILAIILWMAPFSVFGNISDFRNSAKLFEIVEMTIEHLEGRYGDQIQFNHKWNISLLSEKEIAERWCAPFGLETSLEYIECMAKEAIEAFYEVSTGTIVLKKSLSLTSAYDVGSIIHEVTHYVQDRHGLTGRGWYRKCTAWLEYDATLIELELTKKTGLYMPSWYTNHLNEWLQKWENKLDNGKCPKL